MPRPLHSGDAIFTLPVEWVRLFDAHEEGDTPEVDTFAYNRWEDFIHEYPYLRFIGAEDSESIRTSDHHTGGDYDGDRLVCYRFHFRHGAGSSYRSPVRRECRISVPDLAKLPLP